MSPSIPRASLCFRLLLTVSLWHAPVPWAHCHMPHSHDMAGHLASFHARDLLPWNLGWHWHLSLPDWGVSESGDDAAPPTQPHTRIVMSSLVGSPPSAIDWNADADQATFVPVAQPLSPQRIAPNNARDFLATYSPAHSPQQVLSRLTC